MANAGKNHFFEFNRGVDQHWGGSDGKDPVIYGCPIVPHPDSGSVVAGLADTADVNKDKLGDVAGNVEPPIDSSQDTKHPPRPADDKVRDAEQLVGTEQPYSLSGKNCEHFANELRYGKAESQQVQQVDAAKVMAAGSGVVAVVGAAALLLAAYV